MQVKAETSNTSSDISIQAQNQYIQHNAASYFYSKLIAIVSDWQEQMTEQMD